MADGILLDNDVIFDNDNNPLSGGSVTVYETGTTTIVTLYSDAAGTTPTTNPIEVDASGRAPRTFVTTTTALDSVIRDANGALIRTVTALPRVGQAVNVAANVAIDPIVGLPRSGTADADVQAALESIASRITPWSDFSEDTLLPSASATSWRNNLGLGDFATQNIAARTVSEATWLTGTSTLSCLITPALLQAKVDSLAADQSVWNTGASTTEGTISPAKLEAKITDRSLNQSVWNTGTSTTEAVISPAKLKATIENNIERASSGQLAIAADTLVTWAHGLSSDPKVITLELVCTANDGAFTAGNQIIINPASNHTTGTLGDNGVLLKTGSPNVAVYFGAAVYVLTDSFGQQAIDFADWELVIHAMTF